MRPVGSICARIPGIRRGEPAFSARGYCPNTNSGEFYGQIGTRRHHCRRDTRSTAQQRRFRTEQIVVIEQFGCNKHSGHTVRAVSAGYSGRATVNGPEADRPLSLRPNALRHAAQMRRGFWREEIAGRQSDSPARRRVGLFFLRSGDGGCAIWRLPYPPVCEPHHGGTEAANPPTS
jgi:hypothetical protein